MGRIDAQRDPGRDVAPPLPHAPQRRLEAIDGMPDDGPWHLYASLSTPTVVVAEDGWRVVFLNAAAQATLRVPVADVVGRNAWTALRFAPDGAGEVEPWVADTLLPGLRSMADVPCLVCGQRVEVGALWLSHEGRAYAVLTIAAPGRTPAVGPGDPPDWMLRDALTGLYHRGHWRRAFPTWNARGGVVVFFEIGGLKEIADLGGQRPADAAVVAAAGAISTAAPAGSVLVRFGGDEFVLVLDPAVPVQEAEARARRMVEEAAERAAVAEVAFPLHLQYGVAPYAPGGLEAAVQRTADAVYEHSGMLLRGSGGGRIILTRAGRDRLQEPGTDPEDAPAAPFAANFGPEFAAYFRRVYARTVEHAREFVDFVAPESGSTAVEVAAGSGRITFDGGLAGRIGAEGQLLVTDASPAQIRVARRRAQELGLDWLRFLETPVEHLPLASGTVDLVLGSTFLHYTHPPAALREMGRVARRGGRVAVNATVDLSMGPAWEHILEPVRAERARRGLAAREIFISEAELRAHFAAVGLEVVDVQRSGRERADLPTADVALQMVRQLGFVTLQLVGVPAERHRAVQAEVEERLVAAVTRQADPDETVWAFDTITIVARR